MAVAGNLLDAGSKTRLAPEDLATRLDTVWDMPLAGSASDLFRAADAAHRILYLADNAGEIVLDRLIIAKGQGNYETLSNTNKHIFFLLAVKCSLIGADIGAPVGSLVVQRGKSEVTI